MSVKSKVKRCNNEIEKLNKEIARLKRELNSETIRTSNKEQLYENIIKFAITNQVGGMRAGMQIDRFSVDKMRDLRLNIDYSPFENAYIMRVSY